MSTIYHLQVCHPEAFCAAPRPGEFDVQIIAPPDPTLNQRFYRNVGSKWEWTDRLQWSDGDWQRYVLRDALTTCVGYLGSQEVGYFELESQTGGDVEIVYFGLLPDFIGRGLGGALLSAAVERAWKMTGTQRVWVHTCTEDHKHALDNYRRRGFVLFKTEEV